MKFRMAIVAACTGTMALTLIATTATSGERVTGFEKTFPGGDASMRKARGGNNASGKIVDNESPRPQNRTGGGGGGKGAVQPNPQPERR